MQFAAEMMAVFHLGLTVNWFLFMQHSFHLQFHDLECFFSIYAGALIEVFENLDTLS